MTTAGDAKELDNLSSSDMMKAYAHIGDNAETGMTPKNYKSSHMPFTKTAPIVLAGNYTPKQMIDAFVEQSIWVDTLWRKMDLYIAMFRAKQLRKKVKAYQ